jgi:hypothetical protein
MTVIKPRWIVFAFSVAVASSIACGGSASLSPTGPSANGSTAVITGRVNGMSSLPVSTQSISFAPRATTSLRVTISVTLSGVTAGEQIHIELTLTNGGGAHVDSETRHRDDNGREVEGHITAINASARTITVGSTAVNVPDTARIHRGTTTLTFADLKVGDEVEVEGAMDGTTFRATEVKIEVDDDDDNDDLPEVKGMVTGRTGDCPALTFTVGTRVVRTTSATRFDDGCATVQNNARVEVKGTIGTDNVMTAARVELDD